MNYGLQAFLVLEMAKFWVCRIDGSRDAFPLPKKDSPKGTKSSSISSKRQEGGGKRLDSRFRTGEYL